MPPWPPCGAFLAEYHEVQPEEIDANLYSYQGEEAIRHLFRVASSLDSMVLGEPQILGQIKTAYGYAAEFKTAGLILNRFLHKAFSVAKRVRTETAIASNAVSVSFAAVELARKIFDRLDNKGVMIIGAGEMCELAARHFVTNGVSKVLVTNRTFERAEKLAVEFNGKAVPFEYFVDHLAEVDIVMTSTGAPNFILGQRQMEEVLKRRKNRPMFLIDIAVPRDIDPKVNDLDNAYLYDVDDLQGVVQANLKERQKEASKAEAIVEQEIGQFHLWLGNLEVKPTIIALRRKLEEIRQQELDKTFGNLKDLTSQPAQKHRGDDRSNDQQDSAPADHDPQAHPERHQRRRLCRCRAGSLRPARPRLMMTRKSNPSTIPSKNRRSTQDVQTTAAYRHPRQPTCPLAGQLGQVRTGKTLPRHGSHPDQDQDPGGQDS